MNALTSLVPSISPCCRHHRPHRIQQLFFWGAREEPRFVASTLSFGLSPFLVLQQT